jgi:hypothetical protein
VIADGHPVGLHALLARPGVHVLLDRDAPRVDRLALGPYVDVHRLESAPGKGVVAVRPDGYIGLSSDTLELGRLRIWLARIGALGDVAAMGYERLNRECSGCDAPSPARRPLLGF